MKKIKMAAVLLSLLFCMFANAECIDKFFLTKPYLQYSKDSCMTVMWVTSVPTYSWIEYGEDKNNLKKQHAVNDGIVVAYNKIHKFRLTGLQPGKTYYYRACGKEITKYEGYSKAFGPEADSDICSFTLPAKKQTDFTAIIFNDLHSQYNTMDKLRNVIKGIKYDFVVFNGDCLPDQHTDEGAIKLLSYMNDMVGASNVPVLYTRGNHEYRDIFSQYIHDYVDMVDGKSYGAISWGDTRFVILNLGEDKPEDTPVYYGLNDLSKLISNQSEFLKKEVKSTAFKKASKRVLIHHIPLYKNEDEYNPCSVWLPILKNRKINISISGHTHTYRYCPVKDENQYFPQLIGGGPVANPNDKWSATVTVLQKKGDVLNVKAIRLDGKVLLDENF